MSNKNKETVEKVNKVIRENNLEEFLTFFTDDVQWTKVGDKAATGKEELGKLIESLGDAPPPSRIIFDAMIAEGDFVAAYGTLTVEDENGKPTPQAFCDVYRFRGKKIAELTAFVMKTETGNKT